MDFTDIQIYSFGGTANRLDHTAGKYEAKLGLANAPLAESSVIETDRAGDYPLYAGQKLQSREYNVTIEVLSGGTVEELQGWFDTSLGQLELRVKDISDNSYWYVNAKSKALPMVAPNALVARLHVNDPVWRNVSGSTALWNVTASGGTIHVNNAGSYYCKPVITVSPQAARAGGYGYRRWVAMYNRTSYPAKDYVVNVLDTTLNHAALVSGGKAQADGDDFRVTKNGRHIYRWVGGGGWNSTTLKVFSVFDFSPGIDIAISAAIAATGAVTTVSVAPTTDNRNALLRLGAVENKVFLLGTEAYTFTNANHVTFQITGCTRAQKGTGMQSHAIGDILHWVESDVWVIYGNASATAQTVNDNVKPMVDMTNSTNTSLVWTDYHDVNYPERPLSWIPYVKSVGRNYGGTTNSYRSDRGGGGTIASEMGGKIASFNYLGLDRDEQATVRHSLNLQLAGGTAVAFSGEKYRYATSWPAVAGLQVYDTNVWSTISNQSTPGTAGTWGAFTVASTSLGGTFKDIAFTFAGRVAGSSGNISMFEVDAVTVMLNAADVPFVSLGAEAASYYAEATIRNVTTGQSITFEYPAVLGESIEIDCDNQTAEYQDGANLANIISKDTQRIEWMRLAAGNNILSYTETGVTDVDVVITFETRSL